LNPIIYAARIPILKQFFLKCFGKKPSRDSSAEITSTIKKSGKFFKKTVKDIENKT